MKLNLGCGSKILPKENGWVNVDQVPLAGVDVIRNLRHALPFPDGSAEEIFAQHVVEHFSRTEWPYVLKDWVRVLAPGGTLTIEAPDLMRCMENFISDKFSIRWNWWHATIFGEDSPGMRHNQGVTIPSLCADLTFYGLRVTRARPWYDDDPAHVEDPAWHYNLRVEAVKP